MSGKICRIAFTAAEGQPSWEELPNHCAEFIDWVEGKMNLIPKKYRKSASIDVYNDGGGTVLEIYYYEPENVP